MKSAEFIDNPAWADFIKEESGPVLSRRVPTHEDCSILDVESVAGHLKAGGSLGSIGSYEERPGQIDMAKAIVRTFNNRRHLMIEAGTGVGKSLAYLIPAIHWADVNDTPVVVATATRNLQSQLLDHDIPRAISTLGMRAGNFKYALLKGRANYLCIRAVSEFFASGFWTMSKDEQEEMPHFISWLKNTVDGDLDRYDGTLPRSLLNCPGEECSGRKCPYYTRCFVHKARCRAREANLIVANHALVLAEGASSGNGILPGYSRLIFDEAHNLETAATEFLEKEFSVHRLTVILNRLQRRGRGKNSRTGGILFNIERQEQKGILSGSRVGECVRKLLSAIRFSMTKALSETEHLSDIASKLLTVDKKRDVIRYCKDASLGRMHSLNKIFTPYTEDMFDEQAFLAQQTTFDSALAVLVNELGELSTILSESAQEGEFNYCADFPSQLQAVIQQLVEFSNDTNFLIEADVRTHAFWAEIIKRENRPAAFRLVAAPLTVADALKRMFYELKDSVVLCSATLRVGNDFRYTAKRLGCEDRFEALLANSPFNYILQAAVLTGDYFPDPGVSDVAECAKALAEFLIDACVITRGRTLVLFTSYEMMRLTKEFALDKMIERGFSLYVQGDGLSREAMASKLKTENNVILFGAQSFWEGVDVAGDALSCVVIARLPFPQVGDPIIEARCEDIDRHGGKSFFDYFMPEALIKLRQGFGRLIRAKSDRGVVVIADPRICTKNYASRFKKALPSSVHTVISHEEMMTRLSEAFS